MYSLLCIMRSRFTLHNSLPTLLPEICSARENYFPFSKQNPPLSKHGGGKNVSRERERKKSALALFWHFVHKKVDRNGDL